MGVLGGRPGQARRGLATVMGAALARGTSANVGAKHPQTRPRPTRCRRLSGRFFKMAHIDGIEKERAMVRPGGRDVTVLHIVEAMQRRSGARRRPDWAPAAQWLQRSRARRRGVGEERADVRRTDGGASRSGRAPAGAGGARAASHLAPRAPKPTEPAPPCRRASQATFLYGGLLRELAHQQLNDMLGLSPGAQVRRA